MTAPDCVTARRARATRPTSSAGDEVQCRWGDEWLPAKVHEVFDDGTSTVMWLPDRTLTHDVPDSAIRSHVVPVDRAELEQTAGFIAGVRAAKVARRESAKEGE